MLDGASPLPRRVRTGRARARPASRTASLTLDGAPPLSTSREDWASEPPSRLDEVEKEAHGSWRVSASETGEQDYIAHARRRFTFATSREDWGRANRCQGWLTAHGAGRARVRTASRTASLMLDGASPLPRRVRTGRANRRQGWTRPNRRLTAHGGRARARPASRTASLMLDGALGRRGRQRHVWSGHSLGRSCPGGAQPKEMSFLSFGPRARPPAERVAQLLDQEEVRVHSR